MISQSFRDELVNTIVPLVNPLKIVLFGSYAYGTPNQDSDLDLVVILQNVSSKHKEATKLYKLLKNIRYPKDILVSSIDEYEFYKNEPGSVYKTIHDKGVILYG